MLQAASPRLVLASASAARRALLERAGLNFAVEPAAVDEDELRRSAQAEQIEAGETAILLADMKASRAARHAADALVIGADQILVCEGTWFAKPETPEAARQHLRALRGRAHVLETGVVAYRNGGRVWHHLSRPRLTMRTFSDSFLDAYLAAEGEAVRSSVGAYRLEGLGVHLFKRIEGEHAAILGLPVLALLRFLRQHGVLEE
jgi:septum formation protein